MQFIPLILAGGAAYYVTRLPAISSYSEPVHFLNKPVQDYGEPVYSVETNRDMEFDEFESNGMSYGAAKASDLSMTNINDAWKPYGPPRQMESKGLTDTYMKEAERYAFVRTFGMAPFIRRHEMEVPIGTAEQSNMNISIPAANLKGTVFEPLMFYPRVWVDDENWDHGQALAEPEFHVWGANSWPSEWMPGENHDDEGRFSHWLNPWGLNGAYIDLFKQQYVEQTKRTGIPQNSMIRPNTSHQRFM